MKNICRMPLLFFGLCLSALAGAQAGATLIVKTDMNCNWTLDGQAMGLLKAGDSRDLPVSSGEHLIRAATTDEVVAVRIKLAAVQGQKAIDIQLKSQHDQRLNNQLAETARKQSEADVALHPTWTDPDTGLMWTKVDGLGLAVFVDKEVRLRQVGDGIAVFLADDHIDENLAGGGAEDGNVGGASGVLGRGRRRQIRRRRRCDRGGCWCGAGSVGRVLRCGLGFRRRRIRRIRSGADGGHRL